MGFKNVSSGEIAFSPNIVIEAPSSSADSDSWLEGSTFTISGDITANGVFKTYSTADTFNGNVTINKGFYAANASNGTTGHVFDAGKTVTIADNAIFRLNYNTSCLAAVFNGDVVLGENACLENWNDNGFVFNGGTITGNDGVIWPGWTSSGGGASISGSGVTFAGSIKLNYDYSNTKAWRAVSITTTYTKLTPGAEVTVNTDGFSISSDFESTIAGYYTPTSENDTTAGTTKYYLEEVATYTLTVTAVEGASVAVTAGGETLSPATTTETGYTYSVLPNVAVSVVYTALYDDDYTFSGDMTYSYDSLTENTEVTGPVPTLVAETWVGTDGGGDGETWKDAGNWSHNTIPNNNIDVKFTSYAEVTVSSDSWETGRDMCNGIVLKASLKITGSSDSDDWCHLALHSDITGDDGCTLTLDHVGLYNASWDGNDGRHTNHQLEIEPKVYIAASSNKRCYVAHGNLGFKFYDVEVWDTFDLKDPVTIVSATVKANKTITASDTTTSSIGTLYVADGIEATISAESGSTLTVSAYYPTSSDYWVDVDAGVYTSKAKTTVAPGAEITETITAESASAAVAAALARYTITPTDADQDSSLFTFAATETAESGVYTVEIVFADEVTPVIASEDGMTVTAESATFKISNFKKGLYYGIYSSDTADATPTGMTLTKCEDASVGVTLTADMPTSTVKYYKIVVSDSADVE